MQPAGQCAPDAPEASEKAVAHTTAASSAVPVQGFFGASQRAALAHKNSFFRVNYVQQANKAVINFPQFFGPIVAFRSH